MIDRIGRMKRMMAAGMLAAVLLGGCGAGPVDLSASSETFEEEEEAGQETEAQQLEKQLIAILNLNAEEKVEADASLKQAADFFLTYVLQDPQAYCEIEQPVDLDGLLDNKNTIALVYDGQLSAVQAGKEVLTALKKKASDDPVLMYYRLKSIAVAFGEGEKGPVWLVLAQYGFPSSTTGMTGQEAGMSLGGTSQETEETGGEEDDSARPA